MLNNKNDKACLTRRQLLGSAMGAVTSAILGPHAGLTVLATQKSSAHQPTVVLSAAGQSRYSIVVRPQAGEIETFAAHELQSYLERMTGARLPITATRAMPAISIGQTETGRNVAVPSGSAEDDAFRMAVQEGNIILKGSSARASLYSVYAFLERLGCWWFAPATAVFGSHAEFIPRFDELRLQPMDATGQPAMKYRIQDADQSRGLKSPSDWRALIDWMAKNRFNTLSMFIDKYEANRPTIDRELARRGLRAEVGKHPVTFYFLPPERYFHAHPDWYGMVHGRRATQVGRRPVMFETANPQAVATFEANVVAYLKTRPQIRAFQFWPPDGCIWSESPEALALGSPSERMALFIQSVSKALRAAGLPTRVEFLAYQAYTTPPKNMDFSKETLMDFCPIARDYAVPFDDPASPVNRKLNADLRGWLERFPGEVREYTYYAKYSWCSLPVALPGRIGQDVQAWRRLGEVGASIYSEPGNWLALEANHLAFARALWDADFKPDRWLKQYLRARFGKAAEPMETYLRLTTRVSLGALVRESLSGRPSSYRPLLAKARQAMREAAARASGAGAKWAVRKLAWQVDYLGLALRLREAEAAGQPPEQVKALEQQIEALTSAHANDGTYLPGIHFWLLRRG
jgi:hypothetical protein